MDEVIRETRRIKAVLAESMDYDIDRILQDATANQFNSGRGLLSSPVAQRRQSVVEIIAVAKPPSRS